jgi:hypothetical protein
MTDPLVPARALVDAFAIEHHPEFYAAVMGGSKPLKAQPGHIGLSSSLCQQVHFTLDEYRHWMWAIGEPPRFHRKLWEWFFIIQTLFERGLLGTQRRGLAFAVGREPLPALFAAHGCAILATDQAIEQATEQGWADTREHASELAALANDAICPQELFYDRVGYRTVDMNAIPGDITGYDFCWSSCAFEHLGSLERGLDFVENAMRTLKTGGVAVHTTEFNLTSNETTFESERLCIYRRSDIERLVDRLTRAGHRVASLDFNRGPGFIENLVDLPPYQAAGHLALRLGPYDCTSIGLIIEKG